MKQSKPNFFVPVIFPRKTGERNKILTDFCELGVFGCRNSEAATLRSENRKSGSASPEKGSGVGGERGIGEENSGLVWPKLYITLSSKEKEEDFMAMKGCKPPQRPKKRAKIIQRTLLVSFSILPLMIFRIGGVCVCLGCVWINHLVVPKERENKKVMHLMTQI